MRKPLLAAAASLVLLSAAAYAALAQDNLTGVFAPFVVDVQQAVPVEVSVVRPIDGGETVTATVPMTVNVALHVSVEGPDVVSVETVGKTEPEIAVGETLADGQRIDTSGMSYTAEALDGMEVLQAQTYINSLGDLVVIGEVANNRSTAAEYVEVIVTAYTSDGRMVAVEGTYLDLTTLEPGKVSPFKAYISQEVPSITSYSIKFKN